MEVDTSRQSQKTLKQATLSFLKGKSDLTSKKSESHIRKRHSSTNSSSESPSKAPKLSKPLSTSNDLNNSEQEVSSSSEADCAGVKTLTGKGGCFLDRFVKKISKDCNEEISSTNIDLDSQVGCSNSKTNKENCYKDKSGVIILDDPDCFIYNSDKQKSILNDSNTDICLIEDTKDGIESKSHVISGSNPEADENKPYDVEKDVTGGNINDTVTADKSVIPETKTAVITAADSINSSMSKMSEIFNPTALESSNSKINCVNADSNVISSSVNSTIAKYFTSTPLKSQKKNDKELDVSNSSIDKEENMTVTPSKPIVKDEVIMVSDTLNSSMNNEKECLTTTPLKVNMKNEANAASDSIDSSINIEKADCYLSTPLKSYMKSDDVKDDSVSDTVNSSMNEKSGECITSTPLKPQKEKEMLATPKSNYLQTPGQKRTKVNSAKKEEREMLKQKLKQEREEMRSAKKRKLEEEKAEKERVKQEQKDAKEKARQELKEKQEKERLEKEKLKEAEKLKKEEERKLKEEQKLKKQVEFELKQEEKKKREEEKRLKEEEKQREVEEKRKKEEKSKMAFQSFFKTKDNAQKMTPNRSSGIFVPFQLKKDMHLAPTLRRDALCDKKKGHLDQILQENQSSKTLYLAQLKKKEIKPKRIGRILRKNPKPEEEADIEVIHDSEALKKIIQKVKILKFHTDNRPPYCGTWRKHTNLNPRNPFKKDEDVFDYEVDSDDEWEEEEPGESLSCSDGEEEKEEKEENEEEEEDGWMVPHGYLSEDEGCNEDDDISPEKLKLQQIAKAKAWDEEQKRKFHALPLLVVGCFFEHSPSISMSGDVRLLYEYKAVVVGKDMPIQTALSNALETPKCEDIPVENGQTAPLSKGRNAQSVPDEAMPDLIKLVHGNICGIKRLIKEFRFFWLKKIKPNICLDSYEEELNESLTAQPTDVSISEDFVKDCRDSTTTSQNSENNSLTVKAIEEAHKCPISKRQLEKKIMAIAAREKRQCPKKIAWFVHDSILEEFNMKSIALPNTWEFLTSGPSISPTPKPTNAAITKDEDGDVGKEESKSTSRDQRSIMDFTKTAEVQELRRSLGEPMMKSNDQLSVNVKTDQISEKSTPKDKKNNQRSKMDLKKFGFKPIEKCKTTTAVVDLKQTIESDEESKATKIIKTADSVQDAKKTITEADPNNIIIIEDEG